jgi:hypothetical protein
MAHPKEMETTINRRTVLITPCAVLLLLCFSLALSTSRQAVAAQQQSAAPARFEFGGNAAEVPAEFVGNLVFLPVHVNESQPYPFLLDTGALASAVAPELATAVSAPGSGAVLHLPGVDVPFSSLPVVEHKEFVVQVGRRYAGTLGNDFLARVIVEVDYARQTVRLYDPGVYKYAGQGKSIPLTFIDGKPVLRAKFSGHRGTEEADFELDSALDDAIVFSEPFADSHKLISGRASGISAFRPEWTDSPRNSVGRLKAVQLGPYTAQELLAVFSQKRSIIESNSKVAGIIGGGLLRRFTVIFDYSHQQLILEPHLHFGDYDEGDMSGLAIVAGSSNPRRFEVVDIEPRSPGANAGIQKGDVIAGIDDEPAADLSLAAIRELFRQTGHKYKLLIERNNQTLTVQIQMRRLV